MDNKKVYRIGDNVEVEKIGGVANGIVLKGLKVIEASGNRWASRVIERKDVDTFEELKAIVLLELVENNYKITKSCYQKINKYMNNYKKEKINNVEIVINEETNASNIDHLSYVRFTQGKSSYYEEIVQQKEFTLEYLELTEKQKEILTIYSKINSMQGTADILGIAKSSVQTTIERIKKKAKKVCYDIY